LQNRSGIGEYPSWIISLNQSRMGDSLSRAYGITLRCSVLFLAASSQRPLVVKTSFLVDIEEREASIYGVAQRRSTRAGIDPSPHQAKRPLLGQADRLNAIGNEPWSVGEWRCTLQGQNGPVLVSGYWSAIYVREGDDWKFQMLNYNVPPHSLAPLH
jgi:hypothetical protein